jgi:hypothetical protein
MESEQQKPLFCEVCGADFEKVDIYRHWHCSNCWSEQETFAIGHYTQGGFACEQRERPQPRCNQCGHKFEEHAECCAECPGVECECE